MQDHMDHDAVVLCRYVWKGLERLPRTIAKIKSEDFQVRGTASVGRAGERREKSLGLLSQRFVQIFVQSPDNHTVPLDAAAETLLGETELQWPANIFEIDRCAAPAAHISSFRYKHGKQEVYNKGQFSLNSTIELSGAAAAQLWRKALVSMPDLSVRIGC